MHGMRVIYVHREIDWRIHYINVTINPLSVSSNVDFHITYGVFLVTVYPPDAEV